MSNLQVDEEMLSSFIAEGELMRNLPSHPNGIIVLQKLVWLDFDHLISLTLRFSISIVFVFPSVDSIRSVHYLICLVLHFFGVVNDPICIVTELLEKGSLLEVLKKEDLSKKIEHKIIKGITAGKIADSVDNF